MTEHLEGLQNECQLIKTKIIQLNGEVQAKQNNIKQHEKELRDADKTCKQIQLNIREKSNEIFKIKQKIT